MEENEKLRLEIHHSFLSSSMGMETPLSDIKEVKSYTSINTPLPPLYNVPKKGFSL